MKNNKKIILISSLLTVVLLITGSIFYIVANLNRMPVAPTAPESKPAAASCSSLQPVSKKVVFKKSGIVQVFTKHLRGKLSIKPPTGASIEVNNISGMTMVKEFNVANMNDVYTITAYVNTDEAIGWVENKKPTVCGPTSSGCGDDFDIGELITLAEETSELDSVNIQVSGTNGKKATIQCWGDMKSGDDTTDYDYNDFAIVLGYKKTTPTVTVSPTATQAPTVSPTVSPTTAPIGTGAECSMCKTTSDCASGLSCDLIDGRCKNSTTICWTGSNACAITGTVVCVPKPNVVTCSPDCSTDCGQVEKTITSCVDSCGIKTSKICAATTACADDLSITKKIFKNELGNGSKNYDYVEEVDKASINQTIVYRIDLKNEGDVPFNNITITDLLKDNNMDKVSFVDSNSSCSYSSSTRKFTCLGITLAPKASASFGFRVKIGDKVKNGEVLKNIAVANERSADKSLTISTLVKCNQTCTESSQCLDNLTCDTTTNTCRNNLCKTETDCTCPITTTPTPTLVAQITTTPTITATTTPTVTVTISTTPSVTATALPSTGIMDIPGFAMFGGGLLMAVIGILLAL